MIKSLQSWLGLDAVEPPADQDISESETRAKPKDLLAIRLQHRRFLPGFGA